MIQFERIVTVAIRLIVLFMLLLSLQYLVVSITALISQPGAIAHFALPVFFVPLVLAGVWYKADWLAHRMTPIAASPTPPAQPSFTADDVLQIGCILLGIYFTSMALISLIGAGFATDIIRWETGAVRADYQMIVLLAAKFFVGIGLILGRRGIVRVIKASRGRLLE